MRFVSILVFSSSLALTGGWPFRSWDHLSHQHALGDSSNKNKPYAELALTGLSKHGKQKHVHIGFAALGDSYSAGIGTGVEGKENECRQGQHAYPQLIASDLSESQGVGHNGSAFQFLSCTGSTTEDILSGGSTSQIDDFNVSLPVDFALLSVGGNDLGFFEVMNACVFKFYNWYSATCETALEHVQKKLDSDEL